MANKIATDPTQTSLAFGNASPAVQRLVEVYRHMVTARAVDTVEAELVSNGEAFFHVSGAGHEGVAVLDLVLRPSDWLHCHYRDKSLMLSRGVSPEMFFHAVLCTRESHSAGRQMSAHMADRERRILSMVGPVGNQALQAVGVAAAIRNDPENPIVYCGMGDGTAQSGEVLEALAEAVRETLPVLFVIEDNGFSISARTSGKTFFEMPDGRAKSFYGMPIHFLNGRRVSDCAERLETIVDSVRERREPAIIVFSVDRLTSHTNADDDKVYRSQKELETVLQNADPNLLLREHLIMGGVPGDVLTRIEKNAEVTVRVGAKRARQTGDPEPVFDAARPLPAALTDPAIEERATDGTQTRNMLEAIRDVLHARMTGNEQISLFGEDLEDPKGDVFGVTRGLTQAFPGRVTNSALAEATILGVSIGKALAGQRPVAFLQFADFLPIAFNQIATELGSMYWRTNGKWECPVIVMVACGGYRPGLGPFHAQTYESVAAHVPGVDVMMPSTAKDAAGMLNAAFESGRPTLFFYPKVCLNEQATATRVDVAAHTAAVGRARRVTEGNDLTMVAWGGTMPLALKTVTALGEAGRGVDLIDLRFLSPWDRNQVCESVERTGKLLIVHEDNLTCGFGAEVAATVAERVNRPVQIRRITRPDTYIPCNFRNQLSVLPSFQLTLEAAAELLEMDVSWERRPEPTDGLLDVEAVGSSPTDQTVTVVTWLVEEGESVQSGQPVADMEADKAALELSVPISGVVEQRIIEEGCAVPVGTVLMRVRPREGGGPVKRVAREDAGTPTLHERGQLKPRSAALPVGGVAPGTRTVCLNGLSTIVGSRTLSNEEIAGRFAGKDVESIVRVTGIESRCIAGENEDAVSMGADVALRALASAGLTIHDVTTLICSTATPVSITPSLACRILHRVEEAAGSMHHDISAYDVYAACTGYLYAMANAFDQVTADPDAVVLVVTSEELSRVVDPDDFHTITLFGDAATATVVTHPTHGFKADMLLHRPVVSARGEDGSVLFVPGPRDQAFIRIQGRKVFQEAVMRMTRGIRSVCKDAGIPIESLNSVVPHQANGRIIEAIEARLRIPGCRVVNGIANRGNTSSSSIPLAVAEHPDELGNRIAFCAFGGGFTFGAALAEIPPIA
jgi:2-oxoisovalerate dehydrogenase E1 component